jgi:hypothetical protein
VSNRPLVLVCGLTVGDYVLWNWSLNTNHDVLALVSGLTLPPLAVVAIWLLALGVTRLIARFARRAGRGSARARTRSRSAPTRQQATAQQPGAAGARASEQASSRKLAA